MDRHVKESVAGAEDVTNHVSLYCVASRLLHQVLKEIDRCHATTGQEPTNKGDLEGDIPSSPDPVGHVSEHLLAPTPTLVLALATERAHFDVVDLNKGNGTAGSLEFNGSNLASSVRGEA